MKAIHIYLLVLVSWLIYGCQASYLDEIPPYESELVVEAYLNQKYPLLNYALLTKSLDYFNPEIDVNGIADAEITVFEGKETSSGIVYEEEGIKWVSAADLLGIEGVFFPSQLGFVGKEEHYYKMEIVFEGETYTSETYMPKLVPIDTFYSFDVFNSRVDSNEPFIQMRFSDPAVAGNNYQIYEWREGDFEMPQLWGSAIRNLLINDDFFNGQSFSYGSIFPEKYGDTITVILTGIDDKSYKYWESYDIGANQGGPFAQPVNVRSTFDKGIGVFTAMAVDSRRIIINKP